MPGATSVKAKLPSAPVVVLRETAAPDRSVPTSSIVWPDRPVSPASTTPSLSASSQTRPASLAPPSSPKLLFSEDWPAPSTMPLIALGSVAGVVAVPPALPATVGPL